MFNFEKEAIKNNNKAYHTWMIYGRHEADNNLNNSNRELIKAYLLEHPNAKGYKFWQGVVNITEPIYNFSVDIIFDGTEEALQGIEAETDECKKLDIAEKHNGIVLVWS